MTSDQQFYNEVLDDLEMTEHQKWVREQLLTIQNALGAVNLALHQATLHSTDSRDAVKNAAASLTKLEMFNNQGRLG